MIRAKKIIIEVESYSMHDFQESFSFRNISGETRRDKNKLIVASAKDTRLVSH